MSGVAARIEREMGFTEAEFSAVLPAAMRDWQVSGGAGEWRVSASDGRCIAHILVERLPDRSVGALRLPVLRVGIALDSASSEVSAEFLRRFERGFHRGGG